MACVWADQSEQPLVELTGKLWAVRKAGCSVADLVVAKVALLGNKKVEKKGVDWVENLAVEMVLTLEASSAEQKELKQADMMVDWMESKLAIQLAFWKADRLDKMKVAKKETWKIAEWEVMRAVKTEMKLAMLKVAKMVRLLVGKRDCWMAGKTDFRLELKTADKKVEMLDAHWADEKVVK